MIRQLARDGLALPSLVPGYLSALRALRSRSVAIVMYHGVSAVPLPVFNWCQLDAGEFATQMDFLSDHYTILHLDEVISRLRAREPLPPRTACVTFDDGFLNIAATAFPILERRQIPSTVFLVTNEVGAPLPSWPDRLYYMVAHTAHNLVKLNGSEVRLDSPDRRASTYRMLVERLKRLERPQQEGEMAALASVLGVPDIPVNSAFARMNWDHVHRLARTGLMRFGSHTYSHPILARCSLDVQRQELEASRDTLRERELSADLFAYPNGTPDDFTPQTQDLLREFGVPLRPDFHPRPERFR